MDREREEEQNEIDNEFNENKELINNGKKQENEIVKDHDRLTDENSDNDSIEVVTAAHKNGNTIDTSNIMKFKKTKQQTLFNYTNAIRNEDPSSPTKSSNEEAVSLIKTVQLTPSKNLKLRKKKSEVLYNETVRQKYKRKQLHGTTCPCCQDFFAGVDNHNHIQEISRHRYNNIPKNTPEEYWDVNFPSSKPDSTP
ncbi:hypothetical protein BCR36DRAFT_287607 [Piromyces finnis]|uniref:DNA endonuclease activator Ctp1 C-terminal domain-containing protein n=1 Tax=Piromyces finnis TaxID=1754191 RepID=A0A1Y1VB85_9FUNG|nr:hypothetical protein BCR36DRAFT_287607 [Piromyces finnis]|eukprot:ORX51753.1 hypothetical protein BCR36DRAFT_287607 [Piromyces finnis]